MKASEKRPHIRGSIMKRVLEWIEARADKYGQIVAGWIKRHHVRWWIKRHHVRWMRKAVGVEYVTVSCLQCSTPEEELKVLRDSMEMLMGLRMEYIKRQTAKSTLPNIALGKEP